MKKLMCILVMAIAALGMAAVPSTALADYPLVQKVTLGDTSPAAPDMVSLGGTLYLAWNGTDSNHRLNVMTSTDNGRTFSRKFTSGETSPVAPSLAVHNGNVYITWRGTGNNRLNVAIVNHNGATVTGFSQKVTLGDTSPSTPSLSSLNGALYLAWNGTDSSHRLNVMSSSNNGRTFGNKFVSGETSPVAPSLAVHNGNIYITWRGTGNNWLNVAVVNHNGASVTGFSQKVVLGDTSPSTPSLASLNGTLYLAWNGTDSNHRLNVMSSSDNGRTFVRGATYCCTLDETSPDGPTLTAHNGSLYINWRGTGNNWLNVADLNVVPVTQVELPVDLHPQETSMWCWAASGQMAMAYLGSNVNQCTEANNRFGRNDCCNIAHCPGYVAGDQLLNVAVVNHSGAFVTGFSQQMTLGETSPASPSLVALGNTLYLAWNGTDSNHRLNVMTSTDNGQTFGNKFTSGETSPVAPSLAEHNGNVYITWRGTGNNQLNVAIVNHNGASVTGFSRKVTLGDTSPSTPALASLNGTLYLAWNGTDSNHRLNVMTSTDNGQTFGNKFTSGETSPVAPSLAEHNGNVYITWRGTGNNQLNVAIVNHNGASVTGFSQKVTLGDTSPSTPVLASLNGTLYLAWNGTDGNHWLNVMSSTDNGQTFGHKYISGEPVAMNPVLTAFNGNVYIAWRSNSHSCVSGGWPEFDKYNFNYRVTSDKALSWDELWRQINCLKKPVAFSWHWPGGGGHMMVVRGLRILPDGTRWVEINDPWSPCNGDTYWITYEDYDQVAGDHTHWNDYYDITRR